MSENKTGKYIKYALGEIILVVIGILIALQINNWNVNRISDAKSNEYYQRIIEDLDFMTSNLEKGIKRRGIIRKHVASAARLLKYGKLTKKNNDTLEFAVKAYYQFNGIEPTLNSVEELKSSGQFGLIKDKDLRQALSDYTTYLSSVSNIFNIIKMEISDNEVIEQYIFNDVEEHYKDNKINYNFKELQSDNKAVNKFSRTALNWQASVDFSHTLLEKTKDLKREVLKHMNPND